MNFKLSSSLAVLIVVAAIPAFSQQKDIKLPPEATEFWEPEPRVVTPGASNHLPPSDAVVLFDGNSLDQWIGLKENGAAPWKVEDGAISVGASTGGIDTKEAIGEDQIHLEWRSRCEVRGNFHGRGKREFFLMGKYEVQVLDSYNIRPYSSGPPGSI